MLTVKELRFWGREELRVLETLPSPSSVDKSTIVIEVDLLLKEAIPLSDTEFISKQTDLVPVEQENKFREFISRRKRLEPVAYIVGKKDFYKHSFFVTPDVLIPRPETELVVDRALSYFKTKPDTFFLCDICTGSGVILLSILAELADRFGAAYLKQGTSVALDISQKALNIAQENAKALGLFPLVNFYESDLLAQVPVNTDKNLTLFVSNPPYVEKSAKLPKDVQDFEPEIALRAGEAGLDVIERIIFQLAPSLKKGAFLIMELGEMQEDRVGCLLRSFDLSNFKFHNDLAGKSRVVEVIGSA